MCVQINTFASNLYYTYSAACDLVEFPKRVHTTFTLIGMYTCLDFFPAIGRLQGEIRDLTHSITPSKVALTISEAASMCVDVVWFMDGLKELKVLPSSSIPWAPLAYKILTPLEYLWFPASVYSTYRSCTQKKFTKDVALDLVNTINNVLYYSAYFAPSCRLTSCVKLATCVSALALSFFQ